MSTRTKKLPPTASPTGRRYASLGETAEYLGVTERTIRTWIADGRLTGYRLGPRFIRLDLNEVDAAMTAFGGGLT
ncbi:excisionase family DNA-binding protein [Mycolicibacterium sp. HS_4_1]